MCTEAGAAGAAPGSKMKALLVNLMHRSSICLLLGVVVSIHVFTDQERQNLDDLGLAFLDAGRDA